MGAGLSTYSFLSLALLLSEAVGRAGRSQEVYLIYWVLSIASIIGGTILTVLGFRR